MTSRQSPHNMPPTPLVSIIIPNYNYARFLGPAIDSALAQTYPRCEVIVVDDGSTDNSRAVIECYGDRIMPVFKSNGGQGSAFNAGFAQSQGDIIIFLDADDIAAPTRAVQVVTAFQSHPQVGNVQHRLRLIDGNGSALDAFIPPLHVRLPNGDLRQSMPSITDNTWWSYTSGIAFTRGILQHILPVPEQIFKIDADYYLSRASALCAPVLSIDEPLAYYRVHGNNSFYHVSALDRQKLGQRIKRTCDAHEYLHRLAHSLGIANYPEPPADVPDIMFLTLRMIMLKLNPADHPLTSDRLVPICWKGARAAWLRPDVAVPHKLLHMVWFVLMLGVPRSRARSLAEMLLFPQRRGSLNRLLGLLLRRV